MKCQHRDWHTIDPIMSLIGRCDREKAKRIINLVDMKKLISIFQIAENN